MLFLRPETGAWLVTRGVGPAVVELCDGQRTGEAIAERISAAYNEPLDVVRSDVAHYLALLGSAGFFRPGPTVPGPGDAGLHGLALHVTSRCELSCRHCYASPAANRSADPPIELISSAARQARALGATALKVTGGDPMCRPEALKAVADAAKGAELTVLTSGIAPLERLERALERGWHLQISLDGSDAETHDWYRGAGACDALTANLDALAGSGLTHGITLSVCLSRRNQDQIEGIARRAEAWGIGRVHVARVSRHGRAAEHWDDLSLEPEAWVDVYRGLAEVEARYRGRVRLTGCVADYVRSCIAHPATRGCTLGRNVMMDLDGRIYPCIMLGNPEACLGDLREEPLEACLAPQRLSSLRGQCAARLEEQRVCGECEWRMVCQGACPGWSVVQEGTFLATDGLCDVRRGLFPKVILEAARERGDG